MDLFKAFEEEKDYIESESVISASDKKFMDTPAIPLVSEAAVLLAAMEKLISDEIKTVKTPGYKYQGFDLNQFIISLSKNYAGKDKFGKYVASCLSFYIFHGAKVTQKKIDSMSAEAVAEFEQSRRFFSIEIQKSGKADRKKTLKAETVTIGRLVTVFPAAACMLRMKFQKNPTGLILELGDSKALKDPFFCSNDFPYILSVRQRGWFALWMRWAEAYTALVSDTKVFKFSPALSFAKVKSPAMLDDQKALLFSKWKESFDDFEYWADRVEKFIGGK